MTSFQLVNHQLKHIFGGIEPQKNSSLEYLENIQKKITKTMQKAQANHMKIYQAVMTIKASLTELSENYVALSKQNKHSTGLTSKITTEITDFLQDVSEESLSLSKKMESKIQTYIPNLKKIKEKYTECAETLEHYRRKVSLLKKNVEKQSRANIKQEEHQRFQRNKEKLKNAQKEYDQILMKTTKRFLDFNMEGMKDIENDFFSVLTNMGGNVMVFSSNLTKYLCQQFSVHEILLAKQLKLPRKNTQHLHSLDENINRSIPEGKQLDIENKKTFFDHLVEQRQIESYFRKVIEKELMKQDNNTIHEIFKAKITISAPPTQNPPSSNFTQFQNMYNNHELKHHHQHHTLLEKLKEEDPIEACEDLLEIEEPTEISRGFEREQISYQSSPQQTKSKENDYEDRMKKNLQKFNKICLDKHLLEKQKSPMPSLKPNQKAVSPNLKAIEAYKIQNNYNTSKTILKSPDEFFNLNYLEVEKKSDTPKNPQEKLNSMHEHPFNFAFFEKERKPSFNKQPNGPINVNSNNNLTANNTSIELISAGDGLTGKPPTQPAPVSFDNFDFFMKEPRTAEPKNKSNPPIPSTHIPKEKVLATENQMDLLSL